MQAPNFLMRAAFSLCCADKGPVRRRLVRRLPEISEPSLTEKMDWDDSTLYTEPLVSAEALVRMVPSELTVDKDEPVSFLTGVVASTGDSIFVSMEPRWV